MPAQDNTPKASGGSARRKLRGMLKETGSIRSESLAKKKKKNLAKLNADAKQQTPKLDIVNPFELKVSKRKHDVIGVKVKGLDGRPGESRTKALQHRRDTLLKAHKEKSHVSSFVDRRFGELDENMTVEEKMLERFAIDKQAKSRNSSMFNLGDEEELTHLGQSLSAIDDFNEDIQLSDDEDDQKASEMVKRGHFGGFDDEDEGPKTKQDVMMELINKSKQFKRERQEQKMRDEELLDDLNEEFREIQTIMLRAPKKSFDAPAMLVPDAYDQSIKQLAEDRRARPTDRLKTSEELVAEEFLKLKQLENARQLRMQGIDPVEDDRKRKFQSGDDLETDFEESRKEEMPLTYRDGKLVNDIGSIFIGKKRRHEDDDDEDADNDDEDGEDDDEDGEEDGDDDDEDGEEDGDDDDDDEDGDEGDDDIDEGDDDDDDDDEDNEDDDDMGHSDIDSDEEVSFAPKKRQPTVLSLDAAKLMEQAKSELPYVFEAPKDHEAFLKLVAGRNDEEFFTIIHRIRASHPLKTKAENKPKMQVFFSVMLEHYSFLCNLPTVPFHRLRKLTKPILEMLDASTMMLAFEFVRERLTLKEQMLQESLESDSGVFPETCGPFLEFLLFGQIFPTSDFTHAALDGAQILMMQYLSYGRILQLTDLQCGLFLTNVILYYQRKSKRLVPEVLTFLFRSLAHLYPGKITDLAQTSTPTYESFGHLALQLPATEKVTAFALADMFSHRELVDPESFKATLLMMTVQLIMKTIDIYASQPAFVELYHPLHIILQGYSIHKLKGDLKNKIKECVTSIKSHISSSKSTRSQEPLRLQQHKRMALKEFTPKFILGYNPDNKRRGPKDEADAERLRSNIRKEHKAARRELRKNNLFLAGERLREERQRSTDYKKKIGNVYAMIGKEKGETSKDEKVRFKKRRTK